MAEEENLQANQGKAYLIPCINGRERALELENLLAAFVCTSTSTTQQIIVIIYKCSVVVASSELISIVA